MIHPETKFIIQQTRFCAVRICDMFLVSKCRGESDLGLCMTSGLAKRMPLCSADFRRFLQPNTFQNRKSALRNGILRASSEFMHKPRSDFPLHFNTGKFARENKVLALGGCMLQPCLSAGRRFAASRSRLDYY